MKVMRKIRKILIIVSVIIFIVSVLGAINLSNGMLDNVINSSSLIIDGADFTPLFNMFGALTSVVLGYIIVLFSLVTIASIWCLYGLTSLIIFIVNKFKNKKDLRK